MKRTSAVAIRETLMKRPELLALSGATEGQLNHWKQLGLIVPVRGGTGPGDHAWYSLTNAIQTRLCLELSTLGVTGAQLQALFARQQQTLAATPPALRAGVAFAHYVGTIHVIAKTFGPGPSYAQWCKDVEAFTSRSARAIETPQDRRIHQVLTSGRIRKLLASLVARDRSADQQTEVGATS